MDMQKFFSQSSLTTQQVATHEQFLNQMYATWCDFVHDVCVSLCVPSKPLIITKARQN